VLSNERSKTEAAWQWICQQPQFDCSALAAVTGMAPRKAKSLVRKWNESGHLNAISGSGKRGDPFVYAVTDVHSKPVMGKGSNSQGKRRIWKKTGQQKMWNTIKIAGRFTLLDLTMTASVSEGTANTYVCKLIRTGYIQMAKPVDQQLAPKEKKGARAVYRLMRDTGRLAPMVRNNGCWDQNEQRLYQYTDLQQESCHEQYVA
jgi:hypothetical protein